MCSTPGKDLFAEKPFGIDLAAARRIAAAVRAHGPLRAVQLGVSVLSRRAARGRRLAKSGKLGRVLEVVSGFHHSSDLDATKPANWKRSAATCGEIGVLGDLGMHACHLPLRLGWKPQVALRAAAKGLSRSAPTAKAAWPRATPGTTRMLHYWIDIDGQEVPMRLEMKRLAPGETNTWFIEVLGTEGGVRYQHEGAEDAVALRRRQRAVVEADRSRFWHALQDRDRRHLRAGLP